MPEWRGFATALAILAALAPPTPAHPPAPTEPFPANQQALVRRAMARLDPLPLTPLSDDPDRPVAVRRLLLSGTPRDLLVGFYAAPPGEQPALVALQWGRETRREGGCPNGKTALDIKTFFLPRPADPGPWGGWHYRGCLETPTELAGPSTATSLPLDDAATVALSRAILERLVASGGR